MVKKKVIVIGGGIVGLSTAYYLQKEGHEVTVIDKGEISSGASHINAGYLTPSHIVPMAAPGMISKGIRWMFNASSPFYIQPRLNLDLIRWGLKFMKSCTSSHVIKSMRSILDINLLSKKLYLEMQQSKFLKFHLESKGLLMAYKTSKAEREEAEVLNWAKDLGINVKQFSKEEILKIQPESPMDVAGAFWYESDAHSTPELFMKSLVKYLKLNDVKFNLNDEVTSLKKEGKFIKSIKTKKQVFKADEFVIATGAWSERILKNLGIYLSIQAGKGYSFNLNKSTGISIPAILLEAKVAVTPMEGYTRFGGTMEISGINNKINLNRVEAIAKAGEEYYTNVSIPKNIFSKAQSGLRPLSHDGLPFIGRHRNVDNLVLATGHSMMGWSLGPATGKLVTELISDKTTSLDLNSFTPER